MSQKLTVDLPRDLRIAFTKFYACIIVSWLKQVDGILLTEILIKYTMCDYNCIVLTEILIKCTMCDCNCISDESHYVVEWIHFSNNKKSFCPIDIVNKGTANGTIYACRTVKFNM